MVDEPTVLHDYVYQKLQPGCIRLLTPIHFAQSLTWTLRSVDLEASDLYYNALSYTWGSLSHTLPIICDGQQMNVHLNLHSALPFLARRAGNVVPPPIWVDAVCINQNDEEEKVVQIRMMNRIYRRAQSVWVWLGCVAPEIQKFIPQAISLLPVIVEQEKRLVELNLPRNLRSHDVLEPLRNLHQGVWQAILHIMRNSWYERVWIVQEAVLASRLIFLCGEHHIDSEMLEAAVGADELNSYKVCDSNGERMNFSAPTTDQSVMFYIRSIFRGDLSYKIEAANILLRTATLMNGHSFSVAQDRVLSMMGLIPPDELASTGIELHASSQVSTLYTQFSTYILLRNDPNETQFWWPYFNQSFMLNRSQGLPFWVPDLHHLKTNITIDEFCKDPRAKPFQASWRVGKRHIGAQPDELVIRGKLIDTVQVVFEEMPIASRYNASGDHARYFVDFIDWEANVAKSVTGNESMAKFYATLEMSQHEAYWRTLFADNLVFSDNSTMSGELWTLYRNLSHDVKALVQRIIERNASNLPEVVTEDEELILKHLQPGSIFTKIMSNVAILIHRRLFCTSQGSFGFALDSVQAGDEVCVFHGASTPRITRRVEDRSGPTYRAVSDAYVHGLMHGRLDLQRDDLEAEELDITLI